MAHAPRVQGERAAAADLFGEFALHGGEWVFVVLDVSGGAVVPASCFLRPRTAARSRQQGS
ncbi:hypothetical protein OG250_07815 [Streptomyces sp. NBC_00487]|uniref:hypothetical protein n=1 Tax=unclassified Streptomyces TaxID=2593676 RepID=UPI002E198DCA|nr:MULTISPECIES: hypothetical protein [unclassified Streptomyces]